MKEITYEEAEKDIYPKAWKLHPEYTNIHGNEVKGNEKKYLSSFNLTIIDEDVDPVEITIYHGYMEIKTEEYTHLSFTIRQLEFLNDAYHEAQIKLDASHDKWSSDFDKTIE